MTQADLHRLALGIHATTGIEVLVWLTDIAGLPREDAVEIMYSSARTGGLRDRRRSDTGLQPRRGSPAPCTHHSPHREGVSVAPPLPAALMLVSHSE